MEVVVTSAAGGRKRLTSAFPRSARDSPPGASCPRSGGACLWKGGRVYLFS